MKTQRKIQHLLANNGETGENFKYLKQINPHHNFDWLRCVRTTDKIDGTTVQGNCTGIFKRKDKFKSGDPRKHTATEEERYELIKLERDDKQWKWVWEGIDPYYDRIMEIKESRTVYFEVFGPKINARFRDMEHHDIRVFDFTEQGEFVNHIRFMDLAVIYHLPYVNFFEWCIGENHNPAHIITSSMKDKDHQVLNYAEFVLQKYDIEGFVFRQDLEVAKIRYSDLAKLQED